MIFLERAHVGQPGAEGDGDDVPYRHGDLKPVEPRGELPIDKRDTRARRRARDHAEAWGY